MSYPKYPRLNKNNLKTISIRQRKSLVKKKDFARPVIPGSSMGDFLRSLPDLLAAKELKEFVFHVTEARRLGKPIIWGMGGHVVKAGLNPMVIDMMARGWIAALAVNGAFMIHDFEIAMVGETSEDVALNLLAGKFGNTEETGLHLNLAMKEGVGIDAGAGEAAGRYLVQSNFSERESSVLYHAHKLQIPVTVHPVIGADFTHYHPAFSGEATGILAERDFLLFSSIVSLLSDGGIYINIGSAVVLPEVFLKAVAFCAAQGMTLKNFFTAVFDFQRHYRPLENVCRRPVGNGGRGYYFIGPHELLIPLLIALILHSE